MFDIKGIRTFATSAKDLDKAVEFYTKMIGGQIAKKSNRQKNNSKAGQVKEVDVRLGNFEVHLFDASIKPRAVDPHHTLNIPWQEKDRRSKCCKTRRQYRKSPPAPRQRQLLDQRLRSRRQPLGTIVRERELGKISRKERKRRIKDVGATGRSPSNRLRKNFARRGKLRDHAIAAPPPRAYSIRPYTEIRTLCPLTFFAAKPS